MGYPFCDLTPTFRFLLYCVSLYCFVSVVTVGIVMMMMDEITTAITMMILIIKIHV